MEFQLRLSGADGMAAARVYRVARVVPTGQIVTGQAPRGAEDAVRAVAGALAGELSS